MRLRPWAAVVLVAATTSLTGCTSPAPAAPVDQPVAVEQPAPPATLQIPDLAIDRPLAELHRNPDGTLQVPPVTSPEIVGYYADGIQPGEDGPAVIAGHVSGRPAGAPRSVPGVFAQLATLHRGSRVTVVAGGVPLTFEVYRVGTFAKNAFPTDEVYSDTAGPELRLITCGGTFDPRARSYESNVVAFARLVP